MKVKLTIMIVVIATMLCACQATDEKIGITDVEDIQYDQKVEFENGLTISLESRLGGAVAYSYPQEWNEMTTEELNNLLLKYTKQVINEKSARFKEIKKNIEGDTAIYKKDNLHNIPRNELYQRLAEKNNTDTE